VLLIFYVISIAQVTNRGGIVSPGHCFNSQCVGTKSEACDAAENILRNIKKHVSGEGVWQTCGQSPLCREGAKLVIRGVFAVALS